MVKLKTQNCTIHLPVTHPDSVAEFFCSDSRLKSVLSNSYGLRGHLLGKSCNLTDLICALDNLGIRYWPTQGGVLLGKPETGLLEGEID